jgi:hypothetical protein
MGGIIWRLAFETLGSSAEEIMLAGPSEECLDCTRKWYMGEQEWCDDALTDAELDLICGVYKVGTGKYRIDLGLVSFHLLLQLSVLRQRISHCGRNITPSRSVASILVIGPVLARSGSKNERRKSEITTPN